jgi:uncharacterized protein YoxC
MEHANELIPLLATVVGFLIVYTLNGIKAEIKDIKTTVKALEADMRGGITDLDRRLTAVETRCSLEHDK